MATIKEELQITLRQKGVSTNQAVQILGEIIPIVETKTKIVWDKQISVEYGHPNKEYDMIWNILRPEILAWINKNIPRAWFYKMFVA